MALKQRAEQNVHTETLGWEEEEEDDFLGTAPSTHLNPTTRLDSSASRRPATLTTESGTAALSPAVSPGEDAALSMSSDSVSLPTQVEVRPAPGAAALAQKLSEASLDDGGAKAPEEPTAEKSDSPQETDAAVPTRPEVRAEAALRSPATAKEEGPQDLRVFELNSDSGKSTPSNNGKKGSSTDVSEDWEKDFDLDMTEEEVQMALSKIETSGELDEDWENWN